MLDSDATRVQEQESIATIYLRASLFDPKKGNARSWIIHIMYQRAFAPIIHESFPRPANAITMKKPMSHKITGAT